MGCAALPPALQKLAVSCWFCAERKAIFRHYGPAVRPAGTVRKSLRLSGKHLKLKTLFFSFLGVVRKGWDPPAQQAAKPRFFHTLSGAECDLAVFALR